jgi:MFS transporter, SP family, galactose:H+ symporter
MASNSVMPHIRQAHIGHGATGHAPAKSGNTGYVYVIAILGAFNGLLFGYDTGIISGALLFIRAQFNLSPTAQEVVTSGVLIGAVVGAAASGYLSDTWGRRKTILVTAIIFIVGVLGAAFAPSIPMLVGARIVIGLGIGIASLICPLCISEVAPPKIRGALVSLNQLAITSGILISYLINFAFAATQNWRWMFGLGVIPAVILGIGVLFLPESPRWLVGHQRADEARGVLRHIDPQATKTSVTQTIRDIQQAAQTERKDLRDLLVPAIRPALIVGVCLAVFQQITGINTIIYYAPTIFQLAGFKSAASILATVGVGVVNVVFTIVAIWLVDRAGRLKLLYWGLSGMTISLAVLGVAFALPGARHATGGLTVVCLIVYIASFAVSLGPVFWLLIAEIYPLAVRGMGMSVATVANWASNLLVALTFLTLIVHLGAPLTFWLYGLCAIGTLIFVRYLVPETKGRTLEDIQRFWSEKIV